MFWLFAWAVPLSKRVVGRISLYHGPYMKTVPFCQDKDTKRLGKTFPIKKFRRRTRVMGILVGEIACYRILAYMSLKMEMHGRSNPVG